MALFGSSVKRPPRPEAEADLFDLAQQQRGVAASVSPLVRLRLADIADVSDDVRQARTVASADTAQALGGFAGAPVTRNTAFDRALRRSRALTRVALMGEEAARMQGIRDRAGVAQFGQQFQRGRATALGGLSEVQSTVDAARMRSRELAMAGRANALGTLVGGAAGALYNSDFSLFRPKPHGETGAGMGSFEPVTTLDRVYNPLPMDA